MIAGRMGWSGPFDKPIDLLRALSLSETAQGPELAEGLDHKTL